MIWTVERSDNLSDVREPWTVADTPVTDAVSATLLRRYFTDLSTSFYGRPPTDAEVDSAMVEEPSDDLVAPDGLFLVGRYGDEPAGCVGLRFGTPGFAELTRMFVAPEARRSGGGRALLAAAERAARARGAHTLRLDTRLDLVEARGLYVKYGFREIPSFCDGPYSQIWYGFRLDERSTVE